MVAAATMAHPTNTVAIGRTAVFPVLQGGAD